MIFEIVGYEKVFWQYNHTEFYQDPADGQQKSRTVVREHKDSKEFFKDHFRLIDYPGGFPQGQFSYPFQYRLPDNLPGVFEKKRKHGLQMNAKIRYKIKAIVEIPGIFTHDLKVKQHLTVHERLDRVIEAKHYHKDITVRTCCCIPRGPCKCEAWMDKNAYTSGETAQVHVKVNNESAVEVTHFNTKLIREITLEAHGHRNVLRDIICLQKYPGTPPMSNKESDCPLPLFGKKGKRIKSATTSRLVKCQYQVMVELSIPWAPDLEIYAPVKIYEPLSANWLQWQAPTWITQAQVQQVNQQLAVPQEVLNAQLKGGVFQSQAPTVQVSMTSPIPTAPAVTMEFNANANEKTPLLKS